MIKSIRFIDNLTLSLKVGETTKNIRFASGDIYNVDSVLLVEDGYADITFSDNIGIAKAVSTEVFELLSKSLTMIGNITEATEENKEEEFTEEEILHMDMLDARDDLDETVVDDTTVEESVVDETTVEEPIVEETIVDETVVEETIVGEQQGL